MKDFEGTLVLKLLKLIKLMKAAVKDFKVTLVPHDAWQLDSVGFFVGDI